VVSCRCGSRQYRRWRGIWRRFGVMHFAARSRDAWAHFTPMGAMLVGLRYHLLTTLSTMFAVSRGRLPPLVAGTQ